MPDIERQTINITRVPFKLSWLQLRQAIADYLVKTKAITKWEATCLDSKESTLQIKQETEGSPAYSVSRWNACGVIIINNAEVGEALESDAREENRRLREEVASLREQISGLVGSAQLTVVK